MLSQLSAMLGCGCDGLLGSALFSKAQYLISAENSTMTNRVAALITLFVVVSSDTLAQAQSNTDSRERELGSAILKIEAANREVDKAMRLLASKPDEVESRQAAIESIESATRMFDGVIRFFVAEGNRLSSAEEIVAALQKRRDELTELIKTDEATANRLFVEKDRRDAEKYWQGQISGFINGCLASCVATAICAFLVHLYRRQRVQPVVSEN